jgi:DNA-binding MurR/RpiR family transcriptional regulator
MESKNYDLISRISNKRKMSKGQKLIAAYITNHYDKAAFMTAAKLGEVVGVSESTVVRFAIELGYEGYPKMQKVSAGNDKEQADRYSEDRGLPQAGSMRKTYSKAYCSRIWKKLKITWKKSIMMCSMQ